MSEAKFTKGEWIAREDDCSCVGDFEVVANIEDDGAYDLIAENIQDETDAHLIAAAPEMYKFLDDLANGRGTDYPIEKLLAKARGE